MKTLNDRSDRLFRADLAAQGGPGDRLGRRRYCEAGTTGSDGSRAKRAYTSEGVAKRAAKQMADQHLVPVYVYQCPHCEKWHLTTTERTRTASSVGSAV